MFNVGPPLVIHMKTDCTCGLQFINVRIFLYMSYKRVARVVILVGIGWFAAQVVKCKSEVLLLACCDSHSNNHHIISHVVVSTSSVCYVFRFV